MHTLRVRIVCASVRRERERLGYLRGPPFTAVRGRDAETRARQAATRDTVPTYDRRSPFDLHDRRWHTAGRTRIIIGPSRQACALGLPRVVKDSYARLVSKAPRLLRRPSERRTATKTASDGGRTTSQPQARSASAKLTDLRGRRSRARARVFTLSVWCRAGGRRHASKQRGVRKRAIAAVPPLPPLLLPCRLRLTT